MDREALDAFFAKAEDVLTDWTPNEDAMVARQDAEFDDRPMDSYYQSAEIQERVRPRGLYGFPLMPPAIAANLERLSTQQFSVSDLLDRERPGWRGPNPDVVVVDEAHEADREVCTDHECPHFHHQGRHSASRQATIDRGEGGSYARRSLSWGYGIGEAPTVSGSVTARIRGRERSVTNDTASGTNYTSWEHESSPNIREDIERGRELIEQSMRLTGRFEIEHPPLQQVGRAVEPINAGELGAVWIGEVGNPEDTEWREVGHVTHMELESSRDAMERFAVEVRRAVNGIVIVFNDMSTAVVRAFGQLETFVEAFTEDEPIPTEPRERALYLRRHRNTGPTQPGMDGRRVRR